MRWALPLRCALLALAERARHMRAREKAITKKFLPRRKRREEESPSRFAQRRRKGRKKRNSNEEGGTAINNSCAEERENGFKTALGAPAS